MAFLRNRYWLIILILYTVGIAAFIISGMVVFSERPRYVRNEMLEDRYLETVVILEDGTECTVTGVHGPYLYCRDTEGELRKVLPSYVKEVK